MAEFIKRYIEKYILDKIPSISEKDPLKEEYEAAKVYVINNLSNIALKRILELKKFDDKILDKILNEESKKILEKYFSKIPTSLEERLALITAVFSLELKKTKEEYEIEEKNKKYIEWIRENGRLLRENEIGKEYSNFLKYNGYVFPYVSSKKDLLTIIAALQYDILKEIKYKGSKDWIRGKELIKIFDDVAETPKALLYHYPELPRALYALSSLVKELKVSNNETSPNGKNYFNKIWNIIEEKIKQKSRYLLLNYPCNNNDSFLSFTAYRPIINLEEALILKKYSNNIRFWMNIFNDLKQNIINHLKKECEKLKEEYLKELEMTRGY